ncbi:hypothetical protein R1flu_007614 [Riccia fluitans]|uniref:Retrotransposon gag domain-containing protein n=1 Tax=Riccia fluitans TaxID=41844 RepID=A0ABD1YZM7_9MARC
MHWFTHTQRKLVLEGSLEMSTWEEIRDGIRKYLVPHNEYTNYRMELDNLSQMGSIREYVNTFNHLVLQARITSAEETSYLFHRARNVRLVLFGNGPAGLGLSAGGPLHSVGILGALA